MRLRKAAVNLMCDELPVALLFVEPDADHVRRTADHVAAAVAVHVVNMHLRALVSQIGRDEFPVRLSRIGGRFPVTRSNDHVIATVAVDVSDAEAVRIAIDAAVLRLLLRDLLADRVGDEFGAGALGRLVPGHLRIVEREDRRGIPPRAGQGRESRAFVAGVAEQRVFLPALTFAFRILVPDDSVRTGHVDANLIGPSVVVDVGGEIDEAVAVTFGRVELCDRLNLMRRPVRRFIPQIARHHIRPAVAIDVGGGDAFRAEFAVERDLLKSNLSRWFLRAGVMFLRRRRHQGEAERQGAVNATTLKSLVHLSFSGKYSACELARNIYSLYRFSASFYDEDQKTLEAQTQK